MNRRDFLIKTALAASIPAAMSASGQSFPALASAGHTTAVARQPGQLSWLDGHEPAAKTGHTWGHPWPTGQLKAGQSLRLLNSSGERVPVQTWPTAYWPDGSIKWTGHAVPANIALGEQFKLEKGNGPAPRAPVKVRQTATAISVDNGIFTCVVNKQGKHIVERLERNKKIIAQHARLVGLRQDKPVNEPESPARVESFESSIERISVEQEGPVRAVLKLEGKHRTTSGREWLPFSLRLYIYAGGESLQISHTFIYDGDDQQDFIKGLGLQFDVIQHDEFYNRHVRFVGEQGGLWGESPQGITGLRRDPGKAVRDAQVAGIATPPLKEWDERVSSRLHWVPVWNDYTLSQLTANGFGIKKRTKPGHAWIDADQGRRSNGVAFLGGVSGGILFGMRDFWQLHPVQIDIRNAGADVAQATLWFWSPEAEAMDVRFYHDGLGQETYEQQLDALNITYEDYEPGFGSAYGVARTTNMSLFVLAATPSREQTIAMADTIATPPRIIAAPADYLAAGVFGGLWSLPDRTSPEKRAIEERLDWQIEFYHRQVDQRHWYGFWNYGDVMHAYDEDRHVWRYDIGGYAWDNSELSPDLWLWYSFLRTGDANTFRLAENMTRHNRDVDMYHAGRFKGLGTRHNVQHWGCSAKQLRISTAAYRRFHYYITADERTGDVLNEVIHADRALATLDATRKVAAPSPIPGKAKIGVGTDWGSAAANWLTAWERTGSDEYKHYLEKSMRVIGEHPLGFFAGGFGYDADTKTLHPFPVEKPSISHLSSVFGLIEVCTELNQLLDVPEFKAAWLRYGRLYNASREEQRAELGAEFNNNLVVAHSRLTAYVAQQEGDNALAKRAWTEFSREWGGNRKIAFDEIKGPDVLNPIDEAAWVSTNDAAQWGLAAIQNLALVPEAL
ncbi:exo-rhamnogalacturonan lyase family protein [Cellvibrio polysaccharolyticus]|uniref:Tat pathway signal sequence domain protein n=1 Tax=Cellvibrio polysaccharolyticus TaxID=2082724 RepID=A0A928V2E8_9GAMM|nr:Tat pathway signal sequence domain protein [Cellvibrio polysaccharolyticus]MBE8717037.1 Tat pathway signal sequence domain protein [Cellvibrio polysaccharolyticus]